MSRNRTIDAFRGLAILGMVFFSVTIRFSDNLPDVIKHNMRGSLHAGDFVLPLFIFSSGLSLAYYIAKREKDGTLWQNVPRRFALLALLGIVLSHFSAKGFLEMDEVMLIALLFGACCALNKVDWRALLGIVLAINLTYLIFIDPGWHYAGNPFTDHYLGGYAAAPYYLTIMVAGLIIGQGIIKEKLWCTQNVVTVLTMALFLLVFMIYLPVEKLTVTPTFMFLSVIVGFGLFALVDRSMKALKGFGEIEYLGRKPLRYWIMMYVIFFIPLQLYLDHQGETWPLDFDWPLAVMLSVGIMLVLWLCSQAIDQSKTKVKGSARR